MSSARSSSCAWRSQASPWRVPPRTTR
jgi:hypothetical protein